MRGMLRKAAAGGRRGSPVCLPDDAAEAFPGRGEIVFEFADAALGVAGFGGAGVALGGELPAGGFQGRGPGDQLGPVGSFDLGAELEAEPGTELVVFGAEPADLVAGDGEVGAQAGVGDRLAVSRRGGGPGAFPRSAWRLGRPRYARGRRRRRPARWTPWRRRRLRSR